VDLDGFLERTAAGDGFGRDSSGRTAKDSLHDARARFNQDKFAIVSWQRSFCTVAYAHMHERICILCGECEMHFDRCCHGEH